MRKRDWILVVAIAISLGTWALASGRTGFKGSNGLIVARSYSIASTINGQVENAPPLVGARISAGDLLVEIRNPRFDRSRLTELESELEYFKREIARVDTSQTELQQLLDQFEEKSRLHTKWMLNDIKLRTLENQKKLEIAHRNKDIKVDRAQRLSTLYNSEFASNAELVTAKAEANIAIETVDLTKTQLERNQHLYRTLKQAGVFFDNGDASYWDRTIDELTLRKTENTIAIATLNSQLVRIQDQANVERTRIASSVKEEHHAPFAGLVNATFVSQGTKVTSGTSLLQVLDCSNPVVIVPIPEHRIAEFSVDMGVTVYPVDTEKEIPGVIKYISSGPLIGHDATLQVQTEMTTRGIHAVIGFTDDDSYSPRSKPCTSAHRAVVVIHTKPGSTGVKDWLASLL